MRRLLPLAGLLVALAIPTLAQASSQYPYPQSYGSRSSGGSQINLLSGCYSVANGGASNSFFESVRNKMVFEAVSRGEIHDGTNHFVTQAWLNSTYEAECYVQYIYKNAYGVTERQNFGGEAYGHGTAVTGRNEAYWTGNVPFYGPGDSRNGAAQYICTNRWAPTTAC